MQAIVFVEEVLWLESLSQTKTPNPEIAAPQAVCDVVIAAPPKSYFNYMIYIEKVKNNKNKGLYPINGG
jgi:hypothetical protein